MLKVDIGEKYLLSLIVPCYNEQEALPVFYEEVTKVASKLTQEYEIIFKVPEKSKTHEGFSYCLN